MIELKDYDNGGWAQSITLNLEEIDDCIDFFKSNLEI